MSQAHGLLLAHVRHPNHVRDLANLLKQFSLATLLEFFLQLVTDVEVILDRALATAGDHNNLVTTGIECLLYSVLNDRLVHQGQHLFRLRFGGGQEACAETGSGEHRFANFLGHRASF